MIDAIFWLSHGIIMTAWAFVCFRRAAGLTIARSLATGLSCVYGLIFILSFEQAGILSQQYDLNGIAKFFAVPSLALAGWIHILIFDLWVGTWQVEEADRICMPSVQLYGSLVLTFLLGPIGLASFMTLKWLHIRSST